MLAPPDPSRLRRPARPRAAWAVAIAILLAAGLILAGLLAPTRAPPRHAPRAPRHAIRAVVAAVPPPVAPTVYADMTPDEARADNARRAFAGEPVRPAPPFLFAGSDADRAAARACLAAAAYYEAGDDAVGEQAVAQVVLNRVRHPAFPKTVCGVVFQGAERASGCQFTFACDGALARPPTDAAWRRARAVADAALAGHVDRAVGPATHYHADYVVPYWRASLAKLAQVGAHIFYRWPGWWGSAAALGGRLQPFERLDPRLVALAGPEAVAAPGLADLPPPAGPLVSLGVDGVPRAALKGSLVRAKDEAIAQYALQLGGAPAAWAVTGFTLCADHPDCLVLGWAGERDTPRAIPVPPPAMRTLAFMYRKSSVLDVAEPAWDCRRYPRPRAQCLPGTASLTPPRARVSR